MSELMRKFLTAYIEWVDAGAPQGRPFARGAGLCYGVDVFCEEQPEPDVAYDFVCRELKRMFRADGLDRVYPFGDAAYDECAVKDTQHLHQPRIDWIKSKLAATTFNH
jgi:hypothetical protein